MELSNHALDEQDPYAGAGVVVRLIAYLDRLLCILPEPIKRLERFEKGLRPEEFILQREASSDALIHRENLQGYFQESVALDKLVLRYWVRQKLDYLKRIAAEKNSVKNETANLPTLPATPWHFLKRKCIDKIIVGAQPRPLVLTTAFSPPAIPGQIWFTPPELFASIAVTSALNGAPTSLLRALTANFGDLVPELVDNAGWNFNIAKHVNFLADDMRTYFSARIGAGLADQFMNALGFVWRANGRTIASGGPVPDFVYDGPLTQGRGVVLCEAKGSVTKQTSPATIKATATDGYTRQVAPFLASPPDGWPILHGYAFAFGAVPGAGDSFTHIEQTSVDPPIAAVSPSTGIISGSTPARVGLENSRASFVLANVPYMVDAIDAAISGDISALSGFGELRYQAVLARGHTFLTGPLPQPDSIDAWLGPFANGRPQGFFAVHEKTVRHLHNQLREVARDGQRRIELPVFDREYVLLMSIFGAAFADGLIYFHPPEGATRTTLLRRGEEHLVAI